MTWTILNDKKILARLRHKERTCVRMVMLNTCDAETASTGDDCFANGIAGAMDAIFDRKYEIHAYGTNPATAAVFEKNSGELVGAYAWDGRGGMILTARDHRMRLLADKLDAFFHDSDTQVNDEFDPVSTCECCGDQYDPTIGNDTHVAEFDLGAGVRMESQDLTIEDLFVIIGQYATNTQAKKMSELLDLGCMPEGAVNIRSLGGKAIGDILIVLSGPNGESFEVAPSGEVRANF